MTLILMVASGLEDKVFSEDFAGEQVEHQAVLSADENQVIVDNGKTQNSLSAIANQAEDNATAMMEWNIGAPVPPAVESFPGCQCKWNEPGWTCEGSAVFPRSMAGEKCCCCGIYCQRGRRCTDDQCMSIGVDQGDEVREEERKWQEMLKNADFALGDDLPVKIVDLERGRCTNTAIENACRRHQMTPVCDHNSYVAMKRCYSPGLKGTKFYNRHFSHWQSHRQYFGIPEKIERRLPGTCFMANNGNWALSPYSNSHGWTNRGGVWTTNHIPYPPKVRSVSPTDLDNCNKEKWGCWKTFCVSKDPNYNDPNTRR